MEKSIRSIKEFAGLPFYCGVRKTPYGCDGIPDAMPFSLGICDAAGLVVQVPIEGVEEALRAAYECEDLFLTAPVDESHLTKWRGDEFLTTLTDTAGLNVAGKSLLEIGCQTGYVLKELGDRGAKARGCEPGPSALVARDRYGVNVDQSFFTSGLYGCEFDVVVHLTVLEHVADPVGFLEETGEVLSEGGITFVGVPNCEAQLRMGDPGMLLHEHWSYFTPESLVRVMEAAGFAGIQCQSNERVLYAWGRWEGRVGGIGAESRSREPQMAAEYVDKLERGIRGVEGWLAHAKQEDLQIGFYGASAGAANLLWLLNWRDISVSLFDGEPAKRGCYLPGCELPICAPGDLLASGVDKVLIVPVGFSEAIRRFLRDELGLSERVAVDALGEILSGAGQDPLTEPGQLDT